MNILLIGAGSVGQGLLQMLAKKSHISGKTGGLSAKIVGVATGSRGTLFDEHGLPLAALGAALHRRTTDLAATIESPSLQRNPDIYAMIEHPAVDVVVEASPTNVHTGQPALDYVYRALKHNKHVVLANKGPLVVDGLGLMRCAEDAGLALRYEATVMAGTPAIRLATQGLPGAEISGFRGILNGTTNYILTQMDQGAAFADALADAQQRGYAETDPSGDVDGWDAAAKVIILAAALFGIQFSLDQLSVTGISSLDPQQIQQAQAEGKRWKLIAEANRSGGSVRPVALPVSDPLASVSGTLNAITYATDVNQDVTLIGPGAGGPETGYALLSDLIEINREFF